ncbi:MAG: ABC transporter permease [Anaerolineales bacterium]|jgi:ABC-2 type transport system permease protein|nr:ABC transporter permease [Anaerolineales bacterium]
MNQRNAKFILREGKINLAVQGKYSRKDTGWRLFLKTIIARAYPRIIGQQREISWVVFEVVMPMLAVIAYVFVYRALNAPEEYIGFVVMGGAMTAFWMNILWSMSSQLYWEKEQGNLALYIMAPNSMMAILLGMALGGMLATAMRAVAVTLLGMWMFDVTFTVSSYAQLFLVFMLAMVALYGMGMMMASAFLMFGREAWHMANLAQEPIFLASGFYFPIKSLPFWVAAGASVIPLTLGMDAMRQLIFPTGFQFGFMTVQTEIYILAMLSVVFLATAKFLLARVEKLAVREGRITESRK